MPVRTKAEEKLHEKLSIKPRAEGPKIEFTVNIFKTGPTNIAERNARTPEAPITSTS